MSSLVARVHKTSLPLEERLQAACLAAELLVIAVPNGTEQAAEFPNITGSAYDSVEDGLEHEVDASASATTADDVAHLPPRIKVRYLELLLDWAISTTAKSAAGGSASALAPSSKAGKGSGKKASAKRTRSGNAAATDGPAQQAANGAALAAVSQAALHHNVRLWRLLRRLLTAGTPSSGVALSETLLPALTATAAGLPPGSPGNILPLLVDVLRLLMAEHRHAFRPSLEHTAALVAALLPGSDGGAQQAALQRNQQNAAWCELTCQALRLLRGVVAAHPVPKKAFLAVAGGKLLVPLLRCAFPAEAAGPQDAVRSEEARSLLQAALFHSSHIPGLSATAAGLAAAAAAPSQPEAAPEADTADAAAQPKQPKAAAKVAAAKDGAPKHFQRVLFDALAAPLASDAGGSGSGGAAAAQAVLQGMPWMLATYCVALHTLQRQAGSEGADSMNGTVSQPKLPAAADFHFFAALALPLLAALQRRPSQSEAGAAEGHREAKRRRRSSGAAEAQAATSGGDTMAWAGLAKGAAGLLSRAKSCGVYRPTADTAWGQPALLTALAAAAISHEPASPQDAAAAAELLGAILALEHRALQPHLPAIWPLVWSAAKADVPANGCTGPAAACQLAAQLLSAWGELRQLEAALESLRAAAAAAPATAPVARVLGTPEFLASLSRVVRALPSGQAPAMVRFVADGVPGLLDAHTAALGEVYVHLLSALRLDGSIAPAVAKAAAALVAEALGPSLVQLLQLAVLTQEAAPTLPLLLRLYCAATRVHACCAAMRPDLQPLDGQGPDSSADYFAALGAEGEQAVTLSQLLDVASLPSAAPELVSAAAGCAAQRLSLLAERATRLRFSCPLVTAAAAADDDRDDSAGAEAQGATAGLQAAEAETAGLCRWMLLQAPPLDILAPAPEDTPWGGPSGGVTHGHSLAAMWPALLHAATMPASAAAAPDALAIVLQGCLIAATSPAESGGGAGSAAGRVAAASRRWLRSREATEAPHLLPLWPAALAAALDHALSAKASEQPVSSGAPPATIAAAVRQPSAEQHVLAEQLRRLSERAARLEAAGSNAATGAATPLPEAAVLQAAELLQWAANFAPSLCVSPAAAQQLAFCALAVEMAAVGFAGSNCSDPSLTPSWVGLLAAARHLLAAVTASAAGSAAAAAALWSLDGGAAIAWFRSSLHLGRGLPAAATLEQDTQRILAEMAGFAMLDAPEDGVAADGHAKAQKALKRVSKALRSDLKEWRDRSEQQRTSDAMAAHALLAAAAATTPAKQSNRHQRALAAITAGPSNGCTSSMNAASVIDQHRLEAAMCRCIAHEQQQQAQQQAPQQGQQQPQLPIGCEPQAASALFAAAAAALRTHTAAAGSRSSSAAAAAAGDADAAAGQAANGNDEAGHGSIQPDSPLVAQCPVHLQHVSALLLTTCRPAGADQAAAPADSHAAAAAQLVSYLHAAVATLQQTTRMQHHHLQQQQQNGTTESQENMSAAEACHAGNGSAPPEPGGHAALLRLHLRLLGGLAPPPRPPRPALQPGSSFWAGVPTAGGAAGVRRALLASLRQLLEGATADELRGTHSTLQAALREAPGHAPADALPALEASLLALETASGRALASQAERFTSSVLTFLSRVCHSPGSGATSSAGMVAAALCTALRCLESVAARESVLPLPDYQVASILAVPGSLFGAGAGAAATTVSCAAALGPAAGAGVFVAAARLLAAALRHHAPAARRCMALAAASARALLSSLAAWHALPAATASAKPSAAAGVAGAGAAPATAAAPAAEGAVDAGGAEDAKLQPQQAVMHAEGSRRLSSLQGSQHWWQPAEQAETEVLHERLCAAAASLAAVYATVAEHKELAKYSLHLLADYIVLAALPAAAAAAAAGAPGGDDAVGGDNGSGGMQGVDRAPTAAVDAALLPGAYALYGACSAAEVQHLFVTLGGRASGRGRTVLADLRRGYETKYKYEGKV